MARLITFTDPWSDQFGSGYQLTQALIAFGRGEWLRRGPGQQRAETVLPAGSAHRLRVLGGRRAGRGRLRCDRRAVRVCVCARHVHRPVGREGQTVFAVHMAYGLSFLWIGQFLINIGVNVGLLPTKGSTLPFLSYGGSSLVICCACLGLLLRIEWESRTHWAAKR